MTRDIFIPELLCGIDEELIAESELYVRGMKKPPKHAGKRRFATLLIAAALLIITITAIGIHYLSDDILLPPDTTEDDPSGSLPSSQFVIENGVLISYSGTDAEVTVPEGVTGLAAGAFEGNSSMRILTLSSTVTVIEEGCLASCEALEEVRVAEGGAIGSAEGLVFSADGKSIIYVNRSEVGKHLVIPEGIESLGGILSILDQIRSITLPSTITRIPDEFFEGCINLESISLGGVTEIGERAFSNCSSLSHVDFTNVTLIKEEAFRMCDSLTDIVLPKIHSILAKGFWRSGVERVDFGDELLYIWENAFERCKITELTLPASLRQVGGFAFVSCPIERVTFLGNRGQWLLAGDKFYGLLHNITEYELIILGEDPVSTDLNFVPNGDGTCTAHPVSKLEHSGNIVIPEISPAGDRVTAIGSFGDCVNISTVTLPASITAIPEYAFMNCVSLRSAIMPGVTDIGVGAFQMCTALETVEYSPALTVIPMRAFYGCSSLASVELHEGITFIGEEAFNSTGFVSLTLPSTVETIEPRAFGGISTLIRADLSKTSLKKTWETFTSCPRLAEVVLPLTLEELGYMTFAYCHQLKLIDLHEGLTLLGPSSFEATGLEEVVIPDSVTCIDQAFMRTEHLRSLTLGKGITEFNGVPFLYGLESFIIPETATRIPAKAFYECRSLREVVIPDGIKSIGAEAFYACTSLESVTLPAGITELPEKVFFNCTSLKNAKLPEYLSLIGESCFENCSALIDLTMPMRGDNIARFAFRNCASLETISLPEGISTFGTSSIRDCVKLKSVTFPSTLTSIPEYAFGDCTSLEKIVLPASVRRIGSRAFLNCSALKSISFNKGLEFIGEWAFSKCSALESLDFPATLSEISQNAFGDCTSLKELTFPAAKLTLDRNVFSECDSIESLTFEDASKVTLGISCFSSCDKLAEVEIKKGYLDLPASAFGGCAALSEIDFSRITSIGSSAFSGCISLPAEITLSEKITELGDSAFAWCTSLEKMILPEGCANIARFAFRGCTALREITVGNTLSVGRDVFDGCTSLETVYYRGSESEFTTNVTFDYGNDNFTAARIEYVK